eukprot:scaffold5221_cov122-Isochrysis_galbana.AAC.3
MSAPLRRKSHQHQIAPVAAPPFGKPELESARESDRRRRCLPRPCRQNLRAPAHVQTVSLVLASHAVTLAPAPMIGILARSECEILGSAAMAQGAAVLVRLAAVAGAARRRSSAAACTCGAAIAILNAVAPLTVTTFT